MNQLATLVSWLGWCWTTTFLNFESLGASICGNCYVIVKKYWAAWGSLFWKRGVSPSSLGVFLRCFGFVFGWVLVCLWLEDTWFFAFTYSPICGNSLSKTKCFDDRQSLERARHELKKKNSTFTPSTARTLCLWKWVIFPSSFRSSTFFERVVFFGFLVCDGHRNFFSTDDLQNVWNHVVLIRKPDNLCPGSSIVDLFLSAFPLLPSALSQQSNFIISVLVFEIWMTPTKIIKVKPSVSSWATGSSSKCRTSLLIYFWQGIAMIAVRSLAELERLPRSSQQSVKKKIMQVHELLQNYDTCEVSILRVSFLRGLTWPSSAAFLRRGMLASVFRTKSCWENIRSASGLWI